ncbi:MAG: hypothetical protein V4683_11270 [Bacteroidota bacterium]
MKKSVLFLAVIISIICASCAGSKKNACPAYSQTGLVKPLLVG